jgi:hypothetical protein
MLFMALYQRIEFILRFLLSQPQPTPAVTIIDFPMQNALGLPFSADFKQSASSLRWLVLRYETWS